MDAVPAANYTSGHGIRSAGQRQGRIARVVVAATRASCPICHRGGFSRPAEAGNAWPRATPNCPNSRRNLWRYSIRQEASDRLDEGGRGGPGLDQMLQDAERLATFDELQLAVVAENDHGPVGPARHAAQ